MKARAEQYATSNRCWYVWYGERLVGTCHLAGGRYDLIIGQDRIGLFYSLEASLRAAEGLVGAPAEMVGA